MCQIPHGTSHVALVFQDLRFDAVEGVLRGYDADAELSLRVWEEGEAASAVEVSMVLRSGSTAGRGPVMRRAERLGEDIAEAAATVARTGSTEAAFAGTGGTDVGIGSAEVAFAETGGTDVGIGSTEAVFAGTGGADTDTGSTGTRGADAGSAGPGTGSGPGLGVGDIGMGVAAEEPAGPPPGWYHDPWSEATLRWYNGNVWTERIREPEPV
ncbi:MAG: DUF2510 domain-containing protein [Kineosporiaceae bacterium]